MLEAAGRRVVERVVDRGREHGVEVVDAVEQGDPAETIVAYADAHGVDLVVMATHGREGLDRALLGSVTEAVVRASPVPVISVPME